jgi:hypothetical protein
MPKFANRAKVRTVTVGTGAVTLGAPIAGYQSFAAAGIVDGDQVRYVIEDVTQWEIGIGVYNSAGPTLTRQPNQSSNNNGLVNLTGNSVVYVGLSAEDISSAADEADRAEQATAGALNAAAASASSAAASSANLLALGEALVNGISAFSVDANGDLSVSYNSAIITNIVIDANGDMQITYGA